MFNSIKKLSFKTKLLAVIGLLILFAVIWRQTRPIEVQSTPVVTAFPSSLLSTLNASGYVVAQRKAAISTKAQGRLEWLGVAEGSVVKQGQLLARLERQELSAQLAQAKAQVGLAQAELDDATREFDRSKSLLAKQYISQAAADSAKARFEKARAQQTASAAAQAVAQAAFDQSEIRAPFDGVVLTKNANVGDNITPFSSAADSKGAVVTIADMSTLEVEADVSESSLGKIRIGQPVEIGLDALPGERFSGVVARMVPTIDRAKATRLVKLQFNQIDPRVLPDMSAKVSFLDKPLPPEQRKPVVGVNQAAVLTQGDESVIFVVESDRLKRVNLPKPVVTMGELVLVPSLKSDQRVVLRPAAGLRDGQSVRSAKQ